MQHPTELPYALPTFAVSFYLVMLLPLSYTAPSELRLSYSAALHPIELPYALLTLRPTDLCCILFLSYAALSELRCTLLATL
jgi:hypothetical protein